jgi:hypothetical protein
MIIPGVLDAQPLAATIAINPACECLAPGNGYSLHAPPLDLWLACPLAPVRVELTVYGVG